MVGVAPPGSFEKEDKVKAVLAVIQRAVYGPGASARVLEMQRSHGVHWPRACHLSNHDLRRSVSAHLHILGPISCSTLTWGFKRPLCRWHASPVPLSFQSSSRRRPTLRPSSSHSPQCSYPSPRVSPVVYISAGSHRTVSSLGNLPVVIAQYGPHFL